MRIAIFDHVTERTNPSGSLVRRVVEGLADEHEFTVHSTSFDNPRPDRVQWVRIPALRRPQVALFVSYHALVDLLRLSRRVRYGDFDLVEGLEANTTGAPLVWAHFCHRAYLREHWREGRPEGTRRLARYLDHKVRAVLEGRVYGRAQAVVSTSQGLAKELVNEFPHLAGKVTVIANAVDCDRYARPDDFDPTALRTRVGVAEQHLLVVFVALGHFERKGLPTLIDALAARRDLPLHLAVVGGTDQAVGSYRRRAEQAALADRVTFVGQQDDVRPYLWAADAFALPSHYETFSLAPLEAMAAGALVMVTRLHGMEEVLVDGENGIEVGADVESLAAGLARLVDLGAAGRRSLADRGQADVQRYSIAAFVERWRALYARLETAGRA